MIKCTTKLLYPINLEACHYYNSVPSNIFLQQIPDRMTDCFNETKS
jgi:hypothetical protein